MTKKNIEVSLLKDSEIKEVNDFYNLIYKENRNKEKFLWEFYNAPAGKAIYVIAKDADTKKIVGTQCAIPIELITDNGTIILTAKSEDTLVHPDYRGLNIFEKMYELLFEECKKNGIKYIWGFTSAKKPFLKLGFVIPFDHSQSLMVVDIFSSYKYLSKLNSKNNALSLFKIFILCIVSKISSLKKYFISGKYTTKNFSSSTYDKTFIQNNSQHIKPDLNKGFAIKQDLPFLTWRIVNNPYHEKICNVYFSSESKIVANIIFNYHKSGVWYLVNDIYSKEIKEEQRTGMFNEAIKILLTREKNMIHLIRTWDFTHNEHGKREVEMRKKSGFIHLDRGISFVWKILDNKDTLKVNDFYLSRIASQGVI